MNIVISLDCSPEQAATVLDAFKGVLSAQGLEANSFSIGGISAFHCFPQVAADPQPATELPPEPMGDPIGEPPVEAPSEPFELPPEVTVSPTGIVAMISPSPMGDAIGGELPAEPAELEAEPGVVDEPPLAQGLAFGDVRVLTLSTSFHIPSTVVPGQTVLKVLDLRAEGDILRFQYNGFEHAIPVSCTADGVSNPSHTCGPTTVRLVLDIANKTRPCLVDIAGGDKEELLIGDDLIPAIVEAAENVPTE